MIVDDRPSIRRILRALLTHIGFHRVEEAEDGASAIERMRERKIDLVIAELDMTPVSGLELLKTIRAHALFKDTPVVVTTADATSPQILAARDAGANGYIIKPFNAASLQQKIEAALTDISVV